MNFPGGGLAAKTWTDFLTRPDAVLLSQRLAPRLNLKGGVLPADSGATGPEELAGRRHFSHPPGGLYPLDGWVVLMDLAGAQELLDRVGRLDYIDFMASGDEARRWRGPRIAAARGGGGAARHPGTPHRGPGGRLPP